MNTSVLLWLLGALLMLAGMLVAARAPPEGWRGVVSRQPYGFQSAGGSVGMPRSSNHARSASISRG